MIIPPGIWVSTDGSRLQGGDAGLFLDRDGVVVDEAGYLRRAQDVHIAKGAAELIAWANGLGIPVVVVSNQSGIARGLFGWPDHEGVEREMARMLALRGARIDLSLACPFHPDFTHGYSAEHAQWRKPGRGMLLHASGLLGLNLPRSWMIGDKASDVEAARSAGLPACIHILTGHGPEERDRAVTLASPTFQVLTADDMEAAIEVLKARFNR